MSRGEWIKVESLDELTPGTAVKDVACELCGGGCVGTVLGGPVVARARSPLGSFSIETMVPVTACRKSPLDKCGITGADIEDGYIYRLRPDETPAADKSTTAQPRTLERVR